MRTKDTLNRPTGKLTLRVYDISGVELWQTTENNLIVDTGYNAAAEALAGVAGAKIAKIAVGTNGTAPTGSDAEITAPIYFDIKSIEYPTPATVRFNFSMGYTDAVGTTICEFGLFTSDGRLFSRKVRAPIEKTRYMSLVVAWEITF